MTHDIVTAVLIGAAFPLTALAVKAHQQGTAAASPAAGQLAEGELRKVDKDAKTLTIRHGPLESLGMPPMTMVFQVKDPAMLDKVKAGDNIKFSADKVAGAYTVSELEVVK